MTFFAFKIHRTSGPGRGKPVLICILGCSLVFHAITFEHSSYTKITSYKMNSDEPVFFACSRRKRGNRQTETDRHTYKPSTVALAAHARQGLLIRIIQTVLIHVTDV